MDSPMHIPVSPQIDRLIDLAMAEDIGHGDITTESLDLAGKFGEGRIIAKEPAVIAGLELVERIFRRLDAETAVTLLCRDGDAVPAETAVAVIEGSMAAMLTGERTVLNFLQRLSGIATHVRAYVNELAGRPVRLVDTRKTVPGWRVLEKYAVRVGGAHNHRIGLYDAVLVKDNHIAACGGILPAIERIRNHVSHMVRIEVETNTLEEVAEALQAGVDVIMLDNMNDREIEAAVGLIKGKALVEVSGRVDIERLARLASMGVDIISAGALTHAARFVDLSMEISPRS